ncbi:MarR family winged helix-turn-helix transcriptional regulator [Lacibacterium aquatile]|uniref:MarR family winged helix-turn-helix transcriptional regulator n=1 Tax=Lacibacterium aquatile TaxID=1168082 RepID=A0ABW5DVN8_9PROT
MEGSVTGRGESKDRLRLWLRLLATTRLIEGEIRSRLRSDFDQTLPRFDVMAQLNAAPNGLSMSDLSTRLMVSNGNVTGIVDRLVQEDLVSRTAAPGDRRSLVVRLTEAGQKSFDAMAVVHEDWISELTQGLDAATVRELGQMLATLKHSIEDR